jgi:hypothetical protein
MPLTITPTHDPDGTDPNAGLFSVACDNNYTANGYVLTPDMFGRKAIHSLTPVQTGTANRIITYDPTTPSNGKLRLWTALGTEAAGASDQSTITCTVRVVGPRV